ncbi:MAG: DNA-directed RNA polymerase specialized sigma24 family protein [Myxococcota bacterium]|jgi:DNA-directed RNA polymerase specialized sigma24 family protein
MDEIQSLLSRWRVDPSALERAAELLMAEWRPRVRRFARGDEALEADLLQDVLLKKLVPRGGRPPAVLAPLSVADLVAWRAQILVRALIDVHRRRQAEKRGSGRVIPFSAQQRAPVVVKPLAGDPLPDAAALSELASKRRAVWRALPKIPIRHRVAVALRLDMDPSPWAAELAAAIKDASSAICRRIDRVLRLSPPREDSDLLCVLYPDGPTRKSR